MPTLKAREWISNLPKVYALKKNPKIWRPVLVLSLGACLYKFTSKNMWLYMITHTKTKLPEIQKKKKGTTNKLEFRFSQKLNNRNVVNSIFPISCQRTRRNYNYFPYSSILHIKMWNLLLCLLWQCWWSPGPRHAGKAHWAALSPYFLHSFASHLWINTRSKEVTLT